MVRINSDNSAAYVENQPALTPDSLIQRTPNIPAEISRPSLEELEQARETAQSRRNESQIEASVRKAEVSSTFLKTEDPMYGKHLAENDKVVVDAKTKKSEEPNVRKEQLKEGGKQVMGALAPEGMDAGANVAEMLVEISASEIPGKALSTMLSQIMIDPFVDSKTQNEASRLLDSFNKSTSSGNVAQSLGWIQEHKQELERLLTKAKSQGYTPTVRL